jgi:hypothetical protein
MAMKRDSFSYDVNAEVLFTASEVKNMMHCSVTHYDHVCWMAGQHGGFLYGLNNRFVVFPAEDGVEQNDTPCKLSWREVDTLCKILESPSADKDLRMAMRELIVEMGEELGRLHR